MNSITIYEATSEYPATIVLDLTAHIFLKNEECARINYREWPGILKFSPIYYFNLNISLTS